MVPRCRFEPEGGDIQAVCSLLDSAGIEATNWIGLPKWFRYSEAVLLPGRKVSVVGTGAREVTPDGQRAAPREPPQRFVVRGTADRPLLVSDGATPAGRLRPFRE
jgi:hypothetical protein